MSICRNLIFAEAAVKFAEQHLRGRASNRPEDIIHTLQEQTRDFSVFFPETFTRLFGGVDENGQVYAGDSPQDIANGIDAIRTERVKKIESHRDTRLNKGTSFDAAAIIKSGIGNCKENAVLACHYLKKQGIPSYILRTGMGDRADHVFVIIGMPNGLDGHKINVPTSASPSPPLNNGSSVVCDPWYHEWFAVQQYWSTKMHQIFLRTFKPGPNESVKLPSSIKLTLTDSTHVT